MLRHERLARSRTEAYSFCVASTPKFRAQVTACFAWLALALCSVASPTLVAGSTQAEFEERHDASTHAVFLEDACEDSEDSQDSDDDASSESAPALVRSSFRYDGFCVVPAVSAAGNEYGPGFQLAFAARGPPTFA